MRLLIPLIALILPGLAAAQPTCFDAEAVPPWNGQDVGVAIGSARGTLDGAELCATGGVASPTADAWHGLYQGAGSGDLDFTATLVDLEPGGSAGLVIARDPQRPDTAGVHLVASRGEDGVVWLRSSFRPVDGAPADAFGSVPMEVELPLILRIWRDGDAVHTARLTNAEQQVQLTVDVAGTELDFQALAGVTSQAAVDTSARTARFAGLHLETGFEPPPDVDCLEPSVIPQTGGPLQITGAGLDRVRGARVFGHTAKVLRATSGAVLLDLPPSDGAGGAIDLQMRLEHRLERTVVPGGQAYIRGDANLDGRVDRRDLNVLNSWLRGVAEGPCLAAADVNGDGQLDGRDRSHLASYLRGGRPPVAPFPKAGVVPGAVACEATPGPIVTGLFDADGRALRGEVGEGDVIIVTGANLPIDGVVRLGNTPARVHANSRPDNLQLRLGAAPEAGQQCLVIIDGQPDGAGVFGRSFGGDAAQRPDLCVSMRASRLEQVSVLEQRVDGSLFMALPEAQWDRSAPVNIALDLPFAKVEGGSRGARSVRLRFEPPRGRDGGPLGYADWLTALAKATAEALGEGDDCGCDIAVLANPAQQGMAYAPCAPPPPPPHVDPTPSSPDLPLHPTKPSLIGGSMSVAPQPADCDSENAWSTRNRAWCHFADITRIKTEIEDPWRDIEVYLGLPVWESFRPLTSILGTLDWVIDPRDMPVALKYVMVEPILQDELVHKKYYSPCGIAARAEYCSNHQEDWMPMLSPGKRVIKNFFVLEGDLPTGRPLSDYYSYVPKDHSTWPPTPQPRQYLVGMHVSFSIPQQNIERAFFDWATLWVAPPEGATHTRDGRPLSAVYNPNCVTGSNVGMPAELQGTVWANFEMCAQESGDDHCGNPWGPANECTVNPAANTDCTDCHASMGKVQWEGEGGGYGSVMHTGWLTFLGYQGTEARECRTYIRDMAEAGTPVYDNQACGI